MAKLGDICKIQSGGTPSRSEMAYWNDGTIPWVKISDIQNKYLDKTEEHITQLGLEKSSAKMFPAGTILYSIFATLGETCILNIDAATNQAIAGIQVNSDCVFRDYLYYYLLSQKAKVSFIGRGVAQNNINMKILKEFEVPLPPISEQRCIASILDKVTDLIAKRRTQLEKLDLLVKSRFVEMFGVLGTDQFGWGLKKLGQCCEINPKKASDLRLQANLEVSFVPMTAVSENGIIDTSDSRKYDDVKSGFTYFSEEDVLFAKITPCMENGKGAVAKKLKNGIGFGSTEFHVLRPIYGVSDCYWLYVMSIFSEFRKEAELKMTGSAGQRRVPVSFLEEYRVALPPIELQKQFSSFVQQTETTKSNIQKSLETLETLKKSLMQEYFQ